VRVAAVDLGTNTTRLLVADVDDGRVDEVVRREEITRLGESVDTRRILLPTAIARVRNVLVDYRREAELLGAERVLAVGTSAVRDADNGEAFLGEVEWSYGFTTRLLSGEEEASLTLDGVATDGEIAARTLVIDIGGGSTELVVGTGSEVAFHASLQAGTIRQSERHLTSDPPNAYELEDLAADIRNLIERAVAAEPHSKPIHAIAVAGTPSSLAAIDQELEAYDRDRVHGHRLLLGRVQRMLSRLSTLPLAERLRVTGMHPGRAPTIVTGTVILVQVMRAFGLQEVEVSELDILHGSALSAAMAPA
jgi:exopolyphosphatase/guanosine-5'-triphosphate,3'-diphosphate pyrophosphatase